jgi:predicted negative regulator of RcsB-dependent stress response
MNITLGDIFTFLNALFPVMIGIGVLYVGLRKWIKKVNESQISATHQLKTSNGTTVAGYVEKSSKNIDKLTQDVSKTKATVNLLHQRLDEHMIRDHGVRIHVKEEGETDAE